MRIFGSVFGDQQIGGGISFAQYFVAGMIASGVVYTSFQNLAIASRGPARRGCPAVRRSHPLDVAEVGDLRLAESARPDLVHAVRHRLLVGPTQRAGRVGDRVPILLVLQFTSGVFFVFTELPHWMQVFASFFPLKWLTQGMRYVFLPDQAKVAEAAGQWELPRVAAMLALWCVIGLVWALAGFRWQRRGER